MIHNCKMPKIQDCIFLYRRYRIKKYLYICRRKGFRIADCAMRNEKGMQWESATIPVAVSSCPGHGAQKVLQSLPLAARLGRRKTGTSQKTCRCLYKICNLRVYGWKSKLRFPLHPVFRSETRLPTALPRCKSVLNFCCAVSRKDTVDFLFVKLKI